MLVLELKYLEILKWNKTVHSIIDHFEKIFTVIIIFWNDEMIKKHATIDISLKLSISIRKKKEYYSYLLIYVQYNGKENLLKHFFPENESTMVWYNIYEGRMFIHLKSIMYCQNAILFIVLRYLIFIVYMYVQYIFKKIFWLKYTCIYL